MSDRVENIVDRGARARRSHGVAALAVATAGAVLLVSLGAPHGWRLALVVPFALGANGFLQARDRTCVALAAVGKRECEGGGYALVSDAERKRARRQAAWIVARAVLIGAVLTALVWFV